MSATRRQFLSTSMGAAAAAALPPGKDDISLANWSIVQSFRAGKWKLLDMPRILRDVLKINGLEYVNTFFENPTIEYLRKLKHNCEDYGMTSVLMMVDDEGNTASLDKAERMQAAVAHRKWIDVAHYLGCHAIRCNLRGGPREWQQDKDVAKRGAEVFLDILQYAKGSGLNVLIENHGGASSDPDVLLELIRLVNHPKFGMLVDTGNWNPGVDRYEATRKLIRYGKGMSVKGTWGPNKRADFDMEKLLQVCIDGGYHGWWGIEVGWRRSEGVQATPDEIWENEIKSVLGAKAVVERVVLKKA